MRWPRISVIQLGEYRELWRVGGILGGVFGSRTPTASHFPPVENNSQTFEVPGVWYRKKTGMGAKLFRDLMSVLIRIYKRH